MIAVILCNTTEANENRARNKTINQKVTSQNTNKYKFSTTDPSVFRSRLYICKKIDEMKDLY